jgi:hypothetical protein
MTTVILWRGFFEALQKQGSSVREDWLRRWLFVNNGVLSNMALE